jgi:hypothetical protein
LVRRGPIPIAFQVFTDNILLLSELQLKIGEVFVPWILSVASPSF